MSQTKEQENKAEAKDSLNPNTEDLVQTKKSQSGNMRERLGKLSVFLYCLSVFLLPIFFVPLPGHNIISAKVTFLSLLVFGSVVAYLVHNGSAKISYPKIPFLMLGSFFVALLLSTIFSSSFKASLSGAFFEPSTFFVLYLGIILAFMGIQLINSRVRLVAFFVAFVGGLGLLLLYHTLRYVFGPEFLSFGVLNASVASPAGSWFDLGVLSAVGYLLLLTIIVIGEIPKFLERFVLGLLFLFTLFILTVNFKDITGILLAFSLLMLVYSFFSNKRSLGLVVGFILTSLVGGSVFFNSHLNKAVAEKLDIGYTIIRPDWEDTGDILKKYLKDPKNIALGTGPGTFTFLWQKERGQKVLRSDYWLFDFDFGSAMLPTYFVTLGAFGAAFFVVLFLYLFNLFVRSQKNRSTDTLSLTAFVSSSVVALFLLTLSFVTVFGLVPMLLLFIFSGIALGSATKLQLLKMRSVNFSLQKRQSIHFVLLGIGILSFGYVGSAFIARSFYGGAIYGMSRISSIADTEQVDKRLSYASRFEWNDLYARSRTDLALLEIQALAAITQQREGSNKVSNEEHRRFEEAYNRALSSSEKAIRINPRNYLNWLNRGWVLETISLFQLGEYFSEARAAYMQAAEENPTNPEIFLALARLELAQDNTEEAKSFIEKALSLKPNYSDAHTLLFRAEYSRGKEAQAILALEDGVKNIPNDPTLYYYLGVMHYQGERYEKAISAFNDAIKLDPNYANARYFRGLSAHYSGNRNAALKDLEIVLETNRSNDSLKKVIENIRRGSDPFLGTDGSDVNLPNEEDELIIDTEEVVEGGLGGGEDNAGLAEPEESE